MRLSVTIYRMCSVLGVEQSLPSLLEQDTYAGQPVTASFVLLPVALREVVPWHEGCGEGSNGRHVGLLVGESG